MKRLKQFLLPFKTRINFQHFFFSSHINTFILMKNLIHMFVVKSHEWMKFFIYELEMVQINSNSITYMYCMKGVWCLTITHTPFHFAHLEGPTRLTLWSSLASSRNLIMHNIWHPSCIPFFQVWSRTRSIVISPTFENSCTSSHEILHSPIAMALGSVYNYCY
jgi:hypothetical protein